MFESDFFRLIVVWHQVMLKLVPPRNHPSLQISHPHHQMGPPKKLANGCLNMPKNAQVKVKYTRDKF